MVVCIILYGIKNTFQNKKKAIEALGINNNNNGALYLSLK